jgi:hypothetical protein
MPGGGNSANELSGKNDRSFGKGDNVCVIALPTVGVSVTEIVSVRAEPEKLAQVNCKRYVEEPLTPVASGADDRFQL